jgi:hypothetical protein
LWTTYAGTDSVSPVIERQEVACRSHAYDLTLVHKLGGYIEAGSHFGREF